MTTTLAYSKGPAAFPDPAQGKLGLKLTSGRAGCNVKSVTAGSLADKQGVQAGDVIVAVNSRPTRSVAEFKGVMAALRGDAAGDLKLQVQRGGFRKGVSVGAQLVTVTLRQASADV